MFDVDVGDVRKFFASVWQNRMNITLDKLQQQALKIIIAHPEYHHYLEDIDKYIDYKWIEGETNPFLHLSLHLSIEEQVSINQPIGIASIYEKLNKKYANDWLKVEHLMMGALLEMLWQSQKYNVPYNEQEYLLQLKKLV